MTDTLPIDSHKYLRWLTHPLERSLRTPFLFLGRLGVGRRTYIDQCWKYVEGYDSVWGTGKDIKDTPSDVIVFDAFESIEDFRYRLSFLTEHFPVRFKHRYGIFENVDRYSKNELDVLLLLFENPPDHVRLFATAVSKDNLCGSLVSRCISVYLNPLNQELVKTMVEGDPIIDDSSWIFSTPEEVRIYKQYDVKALSQSFVEGMSTKDFMGSLWNMLEKDHKYHKEDLFDLIMSMIVSKLYRHWELNKENGQIQVGMETVLIGQVSRFMNQIVSGYFPYKVSKLMDHLCNQVELLSSMKEGSDVEI